MAGFEDVGALLGLPASNELSYQKGLSLGANTQNALQQARERVRQNTAMDQLPGLAKELGLPDGYVTAIQAGLNPTQITGARKDIQEVGFRDRVVDPMTGANQTQRLLAALAPGSFAQPIDKVGNGAVSKLNPEAGVIPLPAGAREPGGGVSANMQLLMGLGLIDANGAITDPEMAMDVIRTQLAPADIGGVPGEHDYNPYRRHAPPGVAPGVAPAVPGAADVTNMDDLIPAVQPGAPPVAAPVAAPVAPPAAAQSVTPLVSQVVPTSQVASNTAAIASAKARGTAQGEKAAALPSVVNTFSKFGSDVDNLLTQPGFDSIYGHLQGTGVGQTATQLLSQDASNASAARDTLKSEAFTVAIQKMRGLGQLSNMEGQKVESALSRMFQPRVSPAEARTAAAELKLSLANLERTARQEAGDASVDALLGSAGAAAPVAAGAGAASVGAGAVAPYQDAGKEARYKAWKAANGVK